MLEEASKLCRFVKDSVLWFCLVGMTVHAKQDRALLRKKRPSIFDISNSVLKPRIILKIMNYILVFLPLQLGNIH